MRISDWEFRRVLFRSPSLGDASMADFTHFDAEGKAVMVDVPDKEVTERSAEAKGSVLMQPATLGMIRDGGVTQGAVLSVARLAGIMGAKRPPALITPRHPLAPPSLKVELPLDAN